MPVTDAIRGIVQGATQYSSLYIATMWEDAESAWSSHTPQIQQHLTQNAHHWLAWLAAHGVPVPDQLCCRDVAGYAVLAGCMHQHAQCQVCGRIGFGGACEACPMRAIHALARSHTHRLITDSVISQRRITALALAHTQRVPPLYDLTPEVAAAAANTAWAQAHAKTLAMLPTWVPSGLTTIGLPTAYESFSRGGVHDIVGQLSGEGKSPTTWDSRTFRHQVAQMRAGLATADSRRMLPTDPHTLHITTQSPSAILFAWASRLLDRRIHAEQITDRNHYLWQLLLQIAVHPLPQLEMASLLTRWCTANERAVKLVKTEGSRAWHAARGQMHLAYMALHIYDAFVHQKRRAWLQVGELAMEAAYAQWMATQADTSVSPFGLTFEPRAAERDMQRHDLIAIMALFAQQAQE